MEEHFDANMTVVNELKGLFYSDFQDLFDKTAFTWNFAMTVFNSIEKDCKPHSFSDVRQKLKELEDSYVFKGDPLKFFKTI